MNVFLAGQRAFGAAVLDLLVRRGVAVVGVSAPVTDTDRLCARAGFHRIPVVPGGTLTADALPAGVDLLIAAHSHDFIGRRTRARCRIGAIGYHPSLLPRHRGRDAVRWTVKMRDPITGGSVYWLADTVDAGEIAAQDWCFVRPDDGPESLWRRELFPMGLRLIDRVLTDLIASRLVRIPQDEAVATWEPSWQREPLRRPDLLLLTDGTDPFTGWTVIRHRGAA